MKCLKCGKEMEKTNCGKCGFHPLRDRIITTRNMNDYMRKAEKLDKERMIEVTLGSIDNSPDIMGWQSQNSVNDILEVYDQGYAHWEKGNYADAYKCFRIVSDRNSSADWCWSAKCFIGAMYEHGFGGVQKDYSIAMKWYMETAKEGYVGGQYSVGCLYESGLGVEQDLSEAIKWFQLAAEQGYYMADEKVKNLNKQNTGNGKKYKKEICPNEVHSRKPAKEGSFE